jgi:hypothetical protein
MPIIALNSWWMPPFLSRLAIPTGTKGGGGCNSRFGPRRRKAFSPGSKVEPGLKARTKATLSTNVLA